MKSVVLAVFGIMLVACGTAADEVVLDDLRVNDMTSIEMVQGVTTPSVKGTFSAHADNGLAALIVSLSEVKYEQRFPFPNTAVNSLKNEPFILGVPGLPKGPHQFGFRLADAKGKESASMTRTVTVP
jgi:hypothetical protein